MTELLSFLIVILAGVVFSALFNRLHLPWVIALIVGGIVIGPNGVGIFEPTETIVFLAEIGLIFLMFMAGLETRLSSIRELKRDVGKLFLINGLFPFAVGVGIGVGFGFQPAEAFLIGVIFISSSIAVVVPAFEENHLMHKRLGKTIVGATIAADIFSLLFLSLLLQTTAPTANIPLLLFYPLAAAALIAARWAIPLFRDVVRPRAGVEHDLFEQELRAVFVVLIGTVILFEILGLHAIIAGFFAGLVLSEFITSEILKEKLHALSYGLFIPVFFVVIGSRTNLAVFSETDGALLLIPVVILGSMLAKFISGWLGGQWVGFSKPQSVLIGVATMPQLSTTLATVSAAVALGLLSDQLLTTMVMLSVVTTFISPILIRKYADRADPEKTPPLPTVVTQPE